ncbi:MAG: serpin family protein, partial [Cellulosimicrobium funkei]
GGDTVDVESLRLTETWAYAEDDGWRAVRLPYVEGFHADVVLPPEGVDPASVAPGRLVALRETLDTAPRLTVALILPTLDVPAEDPLDLRPALSAAGLGGLLDPATPPDLGGIIDEELYVSQAWQQALLQVDAEGTVAAAVTEIGVAEDAASGVAESISFRVDRPYVFSVSADDTGWPLFTAAIRDPRH